MLPWRFMMHRAEIDQRIAQALAAAERLTHPSLLQQKLTDLKNETHPYPQTVQSNFRYLWPQVIEQGRTAERSDDPSTQAFAKCDII